MSASQLPQVTQSGSSVTPDTPPGSPNAADYEFDATSSSLPSGWSWVNQGSATYSEQLGGGALDLPAGGADESRHIVRSIPAASSFTLIVRMNSLSIGSTGVNPSRHIVLLDSATGKQTRFSTVYGGNGGSFGESVVDYYSNNTTFGSRPGASVVLLGFDVPGGLQYVKIVKNSASSWDWYHSQDGIGWLPIHTGINVSTNMTPDQIGIGGNMRGRRTMVTAHHFRVT